MRTHLFSPKLVRSLLLGLALVAVGCDIQSETPLSDPDKAAPNEKLLGKWQIESKDNSLTLTVRKAPPGYPPAALMLSFTDDNPGNYTLFFCTEMNGKTYVNLCGGWVRKPAELPPWDRAHKGPFGIVKYKVEDDTAVVWTHSESLLQKSVMGGKLKGIIQGPPPGSYGWPTALLQESTADLAKFVLREDKQLFPTQATFKRVK